MRVQIRKMASYTETIVEEGGKLLAEPLKVAAAMVVIKNPYAGRPFVQDLSELIESHCRPVGELLAREISALIGDGAEAYGKGALVGTAGEIEHGSAIIHSLKFGNPIRTILAGESLLPSAEKRGAPGASLDIAIKHKNDAKIRSHHQTFEVRIPDAPFADEIVVVIAASTAGRPHPRIGSLQDDMK